MNIKKIIREVIEEARLSDLLRVTGDKNELHKYIEKERTKEFEVDRELPTQLTLKKRYKNKKIKVYFNWYDSSKHNLKKRIKERTNFKTISEFVDTFKDVINFVFPDMIGELVNENGRYAITLKEYGITIIFDVNLKGTQYLKNSEIDIWVITILPKEQIDTNNIKQIFAF
jgi:hypothetical protein